MFETNLRPIFEPEVPTNDTVSQIRPRKIPLANTRGSLPRTTTVEWPARESVAELTKRST
jgi:hypothetical protein